MFAQLLPKNCDIDFLGSRSFLVEAVYLTPSNSVNFLMLLSRYLLLYMPLTAVYVIKNLKRNHHNSIIYYRASYQNDASVDVLLVAILFIFNCNFESAFIAIVVFQEWM